MFQKYILSWARLSIQIRCVWSLALKRKLSDLSYLPLDSENRSIARFPFFPIRSEIDMNGNRHSWEALFIFF